MGYGTEERKMDLRWRPSRQRGGSWIWKKERVGIFNKMLGTNCPQRSTTHAANMAAWHGIENNYSVLIRPTQFLCHSGHQDISRVIIPNRGTTALQQVKNLNGVCTTWKLFLLDNKHIILREYEIFTESYCYLDFSTKKDRHINYFSSYS